MHRGPAAMETPPAAQPPWALQSHSGCQDGATVLPLTGMQTEREHSPGYVTTGFLRPRAGG